MLPGAGSTDQSLASLSSPSHASFSPFSLPLHPFLHRPSFIFQHQYDQCMWLCLLLHPCPYSPSQTFRGLGLDAGSLGGCPLPSWLLLGTAVAQVLVPPLHAGRRSTPRGTRQGQQPLPHGQALALGWESCSRGTGTEGLTVPGAVPSLGAHQLPRVAPTAGTESLPCWQRSSLAEEAAEKMQLQQTTATRASAAIHTWH